MYASVSIETLLNMRIGLDVASVGSVTIDRAVRRRMQARNVIEREDYAALVGRDPGELAALIDEVVVPETWFFRDGEPFTALAQYLSATGAEVARRRPLRLLSVPCATGEEAYSIAIVLHEAGIAAADAVVDAVDVSGRSLQAAARAVYGSYSFRGARHDLQQRYFDRCGERFTLHAAIRNRVAFHGANLLNPQSMPGGRYDVIFCRNLLIYFGKESQQRAVGVLHSLLNGQGLLFVGHAETGLFHGSNFTPLPRRNTFAFLKVDPARAVPVRAPLAASAPPAVSPPPARRPRTSKPGADAARRIDTRDPAPLERARALADQGELHQAVGVCRRYLDGHGDCAEAYFLLGLLYESSRDDGNAREMFHKAVYLEPRHEQALLQLALLAEQDGQAAAAAAFRRRARRAAPRDDAADPARSADQGRRT